MESWEFATETEKLFYILKKELKELAKICDINKDMTIDFKEDEWIFKFDGGEGEYTGKTLDECLRNAIDGTRELKEELEEEEIEC